MFTICEGRRHAQAVAESCVRVGDAALCAGCAHAIDAEAPRLLRRAVRADHRARWDERGGPAAGRRWPKTLIGHYVPAWFE